MLLVGLSLLVAGQSQAAPATAAQLVLEFQKSHGIKSLKQAQTATQFQQQAQQGSKQQFIFQSISGGKTVSGACILK